MRFIGKLIKGIITFFVIVIALGLIFGSKNEINTSTVSTTPSPAVSSETPTPVQEVGTKQIDENVPQEYKSALIKAESYSDIMFMSKQSIYDQLTSEYGEKFPIEAATWAVENLNVDYNVNALKKAETYSKSMFMSKQSIYDQLVSPMVKDSNLKKHSMQLTI